jgi:hypothetical protein
MENGWQLSKNTIVSAFMGFIENVFNLKNDFKQHYHLQKDIQVQPDVLIL